MYQINEDGIIDEYVYNIEIVTGANGQVFDTKTITITNDSKKETDVTVTWDGTKSVMKFN